MLLAVPKQKTKVLTPPPPINHTPWLAESSGTVHTNINPGGVLFYSYVFDLSVELGIPITGPFLVNDSE